jgi:protein-tyrosine phosphatase
VVDIHTHILPGLDDGAKTMDESVAMADIALRSGTTDIVATPHASGQFRFDPPAVDAKVKALRHALAARAGQSAATATAGAAAPKLRIHTGCDFHLQYDNIEDAVANPRKYTINGNAYLLVEFPDFGVLHGAEDILMRLLDAGMVPVITHPERHAHLQKQFDDLAGWVDNGCCVQVTAGSHTGAFGKRAAWSANEMLKRGLTHFIASDAHDLRKRTPNLRDAYDRLAGDFGEDRIRPLFVDNPKAVLAGEPFDVYAAPVAAKTRKWFRFWG